MCILGCRGDFTEGCGASLPGVKGALRLRSVECGGRVKKARRWQWKQKPNSVVVGRGMTGTANHAGEGVAWGLNCAGDGLLGYLGDVGGLP